MGFFSKLEAASNVVDSEFHQSVAEDEIFANAIATLPEREFRRVLCQERKRSERSRKNFVLMLVRPKMSVANGSSDSAPLHRVTSILSRLIRDTDVLGWFAMNSVVGAIFCELGAGEVSRAVRCIEAKVSAALNRVLPREQVANLEISLYSYPQNWQSDDELSSLRPELYPDLVSVTQDRRTALFVKRIVDIVGSVLALLILSPVFVALALIIKLTSKGPVFFRQERLGRFQNPFVFLKFRSMRVSVTHNIHREYVRNYIAGRAEPAASNGSRGVYKITNDPRVTAIGKFMRRTSLDELPQFWNVLKGDMSLVGPRPPIPYEIEAYDVWHRRRLLEAKPGITGLWQVHGRSRTTFDEMVRLDLRYSRTFSLLSDFKILLETPRAVISGNGAY